jgi:hypothetical protein
MTKVSKEGGCKGMTEWIKPCGIFIGVFVPFMTAMEQLCGNCRQSSDQIKVQISGKVQISP